MQIQSYSLFSIPAGCTHTQQDGESIPDRKKNASSNSSIKSIYLHIQASVILKLFVIFRFNFRRKFKIQYTISKSTELRFWITQYSINKFRFQLIGIKQVLSRISHKSLILKGYINIFKCPSWIQCPRVRASKDTQISLWELPKWNWFTHGCVSQNQQ